MKKVRKRLILSRETLARVGGAATGESQGMACPTPGPVGGSGSGVCPTNPTFCITYCWYTRDTDCFCTPPNGTIH